jgi:hypothetical protein
MDSMWNTHFPNEPATYNAWTAIVADEGDGGEPVSGGRDENEKVLANALAFLS